MTTVRDKKRKGVKELKKEQTVPRALIYCSKASEFKEEKPIEPLQRLRCHAGHMTQNAPRHTLAQTRQRPPSVPRVERGEAWPTVRGRKEGERDNLLPRGHGERKGGRLEGKNQNWKCVSFSDVQKSCVVHDDGVVVVGGGKGFDCFSDFPLPSSSSSRD